MKFVVSNDREEILKVISEAKNKKRNILWQTKGDSRVVYEIESFEYDPIREVIRCQVEEFGGVDLQTTVYIKFAFRNTIFKGSIQTLYKNFAYIQVPDEIKLEELREFPRFIFKPEEKRLIKVSVPALITETARLHLDVNLVDLSQGGLGLVLGDEQRQHVMTAKNIELSQLGNFEFKSKIGLKPVWQVDFKQQDHINGTSSMMKKVGFKFMEPLPVRLMTNFIKYEEAQFENEIGFLGNTSRFKKRMQKEYKALMARLNHQKTFFDYFREAAEKSDVGLDYLPRHIRTLSMVSCALMRLMGGSSKELVKNLTYCALVHDVAYFNNPKLAQIKGHDHFKKVKKFLSVVEKELYYRSYNYALDYTENDHSAPDGAAPLLYELRNYHLAMDKALFAKREKISELASIFIVAHDLTDYILSHPQWTFYEYLQTYPFLEYGEYFEAIFQNLNRARMAA